MFRDRDGASFMLLCMGVSGVGGMIFGYNTGVVAPAMAPLADHYDHLSDVMQGVVTCSVLLGAMIGSATGAAVTDFVGFKISMMIMGVATVIGALLSAILPWLGAVIAVRVVLGLGVGLTTVVCPAYVAEMAPLERKGMLGAMFQLAVTLGILVSYAVGFLQFGVDDATSWRILFGVGAVFGVLAVLIGAVMPESDAWLAKRGGGDDRFDGDVALLSKPTSQMAQWRALLTERESRPALLLATLMAVTLQLTGINAFIFFSPSIFALAGLPGGPEGSLVATVIIGAWNFVSTFGATFFVDRLGRRPLMLWGVFFIAWASVTLGFNFYFVPGISGGIIGILLTLVFVIGFESGPGSLFWVILTEIFPEHVKDVGLSYANLLQWTFTLLLSAFFLPLQSLLGQPTVFWIFGAFGIGTLALLLIYLPETKAVADFDTVNISLIGSGSETDDETLLLNANSQRHHAINM
jgi:sugar porter (SP) family MFS transporter